MSFIMIHKILLMGPQGSGKGTQAESLSKNLGIPGFGMGQLIRDEAKTESELGRKVEPIINRGELISDEDAAHILQKRLSQPDVANGYVLDGYPRNLAQYVAFDFDTPTHVIVIEIPMDESLRRLVGRLTCRECARVDSMNNGIKIGDKCSACGGEWFQRDDDTQEAIARRLEIYNTNTQPVIDKYGDLVIKIDGTGTIQEVSDRVLEHLGE